MKKSLLLGLGVAALALGGAAFGAKAAINSDALETKAGDATRLYLDMSGFADWYSSSAAFKVHTWNEAKKDQYFDVTKVDNALYYADVDLATYASGGGYRFTRYKSDFSEEWNRGEWNSYGSGVNTFYRVTGWTAGTWSTADQGTWNLVGASSGTWKDPEDQDIDISLTKRIDNDGLAFYSTSLALSTGSVFKVKNNDDVYWGSNKFKSNALTKTYLSIDEENDKNISVTVGGTFEIYVKPAAGEVWIQVDSATEATGFASTFLSSTSSICSAGSTSADHAEALAAVWNSTGDGTKLVDKWNALSSGAKTVFKTGTANATVTDAHDRYVHIMKRYSESLTAFEGGPVLSAKTASPAMAASNDSAVIWTVALVSVGIAALLGATFIIRKRRQD